MGAATVSTLTVLTGGVAQGREGGQALQIRGVDLRRAGHGGGRRVRGRRRAEAEVLLQQQLMLHVRQRVRPGVRGDRGRGARRRLQLLQQLQRGGCQGGGMRVVLQAQNIADRRRTPSREFTIDN